MEAMSGMGIITMILMFGSFIFWIWALIDILRSDFNDSINKLIWLLVVFFLYALGAVLYIIIGKNQKNQKKL